MTKRPTPGQLARLRSYTEHFRGDVRITDLLPLLDAYDHAVRCLHDIGDAHRCCMARSHYYGHDKACWFYEPPKEETKCSP